MQNADELDRFSIRQIQPEDNTEIELICRSTLHAFGLKEANSAAGDPELGAMYEAYQGEGSEYWVLVDEGEVVGGGGFAKLKGSEGSLCELQKMYFAEHVRGKGLGRRLLSFLIERMKACGYATCYLETIGEMTAAQRLYEAMGFERLSAPMGCTGHTACNIWFAKKL